MSTPRPPQPAKLVMSLLLKEIALLTELSADLSHWFGPLQQVTPWLAFDYTQYYRREMGAPLQRCLLSFAPLVSQAELAAIKRRTNAVEDLYRIDGQRRINLDPGCLLPARFVLATGKDHAHRIYIGGGIYADLTLIYAQGRFQSLPWTYPDYRDEQLQAYLAGMRSAYLAELRGGAAADGADS